MPRASKATVESFFESVATINCYVRNEPRFQIVLARNFLFTLFIAGVGWTMSASELWVAAQRVMPSWGPRSQEGHSEHGLTGGDGAWGSDLGFG